MNHTQQKFCSKRTVNWLAGLTIMNSYIKVQ